MSKRSLSSKQCDNEPPNKRQKITNEILETFQNALKNNNNKFNDIQFIVGDMIINKYLMQTD